MVKKKFIYTGREDEEVILYLNELDKCIDKLTSLLIGFPGFGLPMDISNAMKLIEEEKRKLFKKYSIKTDTFKNNLQRETKQLVV